jgi:6-phosphogluconate dehydrogenase/gluconokinase
MLIVICGVSGTGKTTVGKLVAERLDLPFYDADDFHPPSNVEKMASGIPLDDADRQPWLEKLASKMADWQLRGGAILACSALKESYRATLESRCSGPVGWVILLGSEELLARRLASRKGHFFDRELLRTQLDALEVPGYGWQMDIERSPREILQEIFERLNEVRSSHSG